MRPLEMLVLYLLVGLGAGLFVRRREEWLAVPLWPFYLPLLVSRASEGTRAPADIPAGAALPASDTEIPARAQEPAARPTGPWHGRVAEAIGRLRGALAAGDPLPEASTASIATAERGLSTLADRLFELEALCATPANDAGVCRRALDDAGPDDAPLLAARLRNLERLVAVRTQHRAELVDALSAVEDLTVRLQLLRLAGDGAESVTRELRDLADAIDGAGEVRRLGRAARAG